MAVIVEAPAQNALPGGLLPVATIRPAQGHALADGAQYDAEVCGTANILPGAICGMATLVVSAVDGSVSAEVRNAPAGNYTFVAEWTDVTPQTDTETDRGPNPSVTFAGSTVPNGATVTVSVTSNAGVTYEDVEVTLTAGGDLAATEFPIGPKLFDTVGLIEGEAFFVYKGVHCLYVGEDYKAWAQRALESAEDRAVEEGFLRSVLAQASTIDLTPTPGTAVNLVQAVAIFERYAGLNYGGTPIIHAARSTVTYGLDQDAFTAKDSQVRTKQGIPVANGAGYESNLGPDGTPADPGEAWLYLTGAVTLLQGEVGVHESTDYENNDRLALAERGWIPLVDCFAVAVLVTLEEA